MTENAKQKSICIFWIEKTLPIGTLKEFKKLNLLKSMKIRTRKCGKKKGF